MSGHLKRKAFVIGGAITRFIGKGNPNFISKGHADFGKKTNPALEWYISEVRRYERAVCCLSRIRGLDSRSPRR
jgi:hypothetical protein